MFSEILEGAYVVAVLILLFGVTIFIHEFGHYLLARLCGLVVEVFSIGFGHAIWKKEVNGIKYKIGWIPFGGYVALPQLDPGGMEKIQGAESGEGEAQPKVYPEVALWKKMVVSVAGATGNIILAVILAWTVYLVGMPLTKATQSTKLGAVTQSSEAYSKGLRIGDSIVAVNGVKVDSWGSCVQEIALSQDQVTIEAAATDGSIKSINLKTDTLDYGISMIPGINIEERCIVGEVAPGMSAEKAGMLKGDIITDFAGIEVLSPGHLTSLVSANKDMAVEAVVDRKTESGYESISINVTPDYDESTGLIRIGIMFAQDIPMADKSIKIHPRPGDQLKQHSMAIFRLLKDLFTPGRSGKAAQMVGGPVAIISHYTSLIKASFMLALWFTGFLNVNLAILNLLPVPVLDGGHIMFALWEVVTRKKPHPVLVNVLVNGFALLLIGMFVFLSLRDADRYTPLGRMIRSLITTEQEAAPAEQAQPEKSE